MDKHALQQEYLELKAKAQEKVKELQDLMEDATDEAREEYAEQAEKLKAFTHNMGEKIEAASEDITAEALEEWAEFKTNATEKLSALRERFNTWYAGK